MASLIKTIFIIHLISILSRDLIVKGQFIEGLGDLLTAAAAPLVLLNPLAYLPIPVITTEDESILSTHIISKGPAINLAKKYIYLTEAAYCPELHKWNCTNCKKAVGYKYVTTLEDSIHNTLALITVNEPLKEIVVAFRGTYNLRNIIHDATLSKVGILSGRGKGPFEIFDTIRKLAGEKEEEIFVHKGFLQATNSLYEKVVFKLMDIMEGSEEKYSVILTGHSLGAAMASITLYFLNERIKVPESFPTPASYSFFGYGEPRVGDKGYADYFNSQENMQITRVVNKADSVARMATAKSGYLHHGTELWITPEEEEKVCSKEVYEDPECSKSMPIRKLNIIDHVNYWDVAYLDCAIENPALLFSQFLLG